MTESPQAEPQPVLFIATDEAGNRRVYRGSAYVFASEIWIDEIDDKGKAWLKKWWEYGSLSSSEVTISTAPQRGQKQELFQGFLTFSYLNPYDTPDKSQRSIERFVAGLRILQPFKGTPLHRNWNEVKRDGNVWYSEEWVLYSDARFAGEIRDLGPYEIINTVPKQEPVMGALVFRAGIHSSFSHYDQYIPKELHKTHKDFLGFRERIVISFCGEMAAILSVATDKRLLEGSTIRIFGTEFGAKGQPKHAGPPPHLHHAERSILPYYSYTEPENLSPATEIIKKYLHLNKHDAATFLRSARLYQRALIECDEDANLAWLWCVSAIETLAEVPGEITGVKDKFINLLIQNLPDPPSVRPPHHQVDWNGLRPAFQQIYAYRSQYLHAGFPFPTPMTRRPEDESSGQGRFGERPHGGLGFGGTTFESETSPMHFHVFAYIVRGAMLKWLQRTYEASCTVQVPDDAEDGTDSPEEGSGDGAPV